MIKTIADQYLAQNAGRRYPFKDDTELPDWLPDSGVLDFRCTLYGVGAGTAPEARLVNVAHVGGGDVRFTVDLSAGGVAVDTIRFLVPSDLSPEPYTAYASGDRSTGALTVTAAAIPPSTEAGEYPVDIPLAATTVVCDSLKVMSLQSAHDPADALDNDDPDGRDPVARLTGEIVLAEGRNAEPYLDGHHLRLDIRKGAGLGENCQSTVSGQTCDNVLFTINGERPGSDGNIRIVGEDGITVTPEPDEHALTVRMDTAAHDTLASECASTCNGG